MAPLRGFHSVVVTARPGDEQLDPAVLSSCCAIKKMSEQVLPDVRVGGGGGGDVAGSGGVGGGWSPAHNSELGYRVCMQGGYRWPAGWLTRCRSEDNLSPLWCESVTHFLPSPTPPRFLTPPLPPPHVAPCPLFGASGGLCREHCASCGLNSSIPMCIHILIVFFHSVHMLLLLPPLPPPLPLQLK